MKIKERIYDLETNETLEIEREMTADELKAHNAAIERLALEEEGRKIAEASRYAALEKLATLGLNADDLKALGI